MDLRLKRRRARVAAKHTFSFIGAALFLWLSPVQTNASQMGADYMLPAEAKGGFITSVSSIESAGSVPTMSPGAGGAPTRRWTAVRTNLYSITAAS